GLSGSPTTVSWARGGQGSGQGFKRPSARPLLGKTSQSAQVTMVLLKNPKRMPQAIMETPIQTYTLRLVAPRAIRVGAVIWLASTSGPRSTTPGTPNRSTYFAIFCLRPEA